MLMFAFYLFVSLFFGSLFIFGAPRSARLQNQSADAKATLSFGFFPLLLLLSLALTL